MESASESFSLMVAANFQQIASVVHDIHRYKSVTYSLAMTRLCWSGKGGWIGGCAANPSPLRTTRSAVIASLSDSWRGGTTKQSVHGNFRQSTPPKLHFRPSLLACRHQVGKYLFIRTSISPRELLQMTTGIKFFPFRIMFVY